MENELLRMKQQSLRGTDSNSLLRLYDRLNETLSTSPSQLTRIKAGKAVARIANELRRRRLLNAVEGANPEAPALPANGPLAYLGDEPKRPQDGGPDFRPAHVEAQGRLVAKVHG